MRPLTRARALRALALALVALLASAGIASAQQDERPSNDRRDTPDLLEDEPSPLAPARPATVPNERAPRIAPRVRVRAFAFEGNTAFTSAELTEVIADAVGRPLATEDLIAVRDRLTRHYVHAGYETSGALLPDQDVSDGIVRFRIVEGALVAVEVKGVGRFSPRYFESRLLEAGRAPLDVAAIETALHGFQQDPLIERVVARVEPAGALGESRLVLEVKEARGDDVRLLVENDRSPAVGAETGAFRVRSTNWIGQRDEVTVAGWFTEGLRDVEARWAVPLDRHDTRFETRVRFTRSELVESTFDALDIESESIFVSIGLVRPVFRTREHRVEWGIQADWRRGQSTLDGSLFCFQPEVVDCSPTVTALRARADWTWRGRNHALAVRTGLSWGLGALGATTRPGNLPDGRFVAWLTQGQLALRMSRGARLVSRFDLQLTDDPLLAFERIAVGGARTVRGYRPNQIVKDSGFNGSVEWREPIWRRSTGPAWIELAPFFDVGHAWNERDDAGNDTIASAGLGLVGRPHERVEASLYWGGRLLGVDRVGSGAIGQGLHFRVVVDAW